MTFLQSSSLCVDTQREILSYLSTYEYGVLRQLCREMVSNTIIHRCVRSYRLHGILSYERLLDRIPLDYIQYLCVECKNVVIPSSDLHLPQLQKIKFYAMYSLYTIFFDWERFFSYVKSPRLCEVEWQNVPFPFEEMTMVLTKYGVGKQLKKVALPQDIFHHFETTPEVYNQAIVSFYRACPNLENLRLDMDTKSMDFMYLPLFDSHFANLRRLQLVNRSKTLMDRICNDVQCLPLLYDLEILWIYDSNPLFPTVGVMHASSMSMPLLIRKPNLARLRLSYHGWGQTSLHTPRSTSSPLQCYLTLETNQAVTLVLEHVHVRVVKFSFPPLYNNKTN